jgi:hypothetical protein
MVVMKQDAVEARRRRLLALLGRYCALGRLLPRGDNVTIAVLASDPVKRADMQLVLAEAAKVQAEIDVLLAESREKR